MRIESTRVGRLPRRIAGRAGAAAFVVFVAATTVLYALHFEPVALPLLAMAIAALVALGARRAALRWRVPARGGAVELREGCLVVKIDDAAQTIPTDDVLGALVALDGAQPWLEIALRDGDVIVARLQEAHEADAFLERMESRGLQRRFEIRARSPSLAWVPVGAQLFASAVPPMAGLYFCAAVYRLHQKPLALAVLAGIAVLGGWVRAHRHLSPSITVAVDGLEIGTTFGTRYVSWSDVDAVYVAEPGVVAVALVRGESVRLDVPPAMAEWTVTHLRRALHRHLGTRGRATPELLDRGTRSLEDWRRALDEAVGTGAAGAYRGHGLEREELERVLLDAAAPPGRRLGAALGLLAAIEEPAARDAAATRIRLTAAACANEPLRIALERAAADELDDAAADAVTADRIATHHVRPR